jgi:creatinine amidohydrolase/Fe(II)-dependent formamide hydrolase-like protein
MLNCLAWQEKKTTRKRSQARREQSIHAMGASEQHGPALI